MPEPIRLAVPATWNRRRFLTTSALGLGVVAAGGLLAACGSDEESAGDTAAPGTAGGSDTTAAAADATETTAAPAASSKVSAAMGWINNVEYGGSWLALENGFYAEEGLEVEYLQGGPNAPSPPVALAAGDAQIGIAASMTQLIDAIVEGNDFVIFATQYQVSPGAVLSLAAKPVRTPEDLVGITFLGQEGVDVNIDAVLDIAGLPKDYEFVIAGFTPDPLLEGQGDAYSCFLVNQPITLEQRGLVEGEDFVVTTWAELGTPSYANLFFAPREWYEANRETVVKFMRATIKGWEKNEEDPAVAATLAVEKYGVDLGLDPVQQKRQNELQIPLMQSELTASSGLMRLDPAQWDGPMRDALVASGRPDVPASADVFDLTLLDEVFGSATRLLG